MNLSSRENCTGLHPVSYGNTVANVKFTNYLLRKSLVVRLPMWWNWQTR